MSSSGTCTQYTQPLLPARALASSWPWPFLLRHGPRIQPLTYFFSIGDLEAFTIIRLGMNPNCGSTPLSLERWFVYPPLPGVVKTLSSVSFGELQYFKYRPSPTQSANVRSSISAHSRTTHLGLLLTSVPQDGFLSSLSEVRA